MRFPGTLKRFFALGAEATRRMNRVAALGFFMEASLPFVLLFTVVAVPGRDWPSYTDASGVVIIAGIEDGGRVLDLARSLRCVLLVLRSRCESDRDKNELDTVLCPIPGFVLGLCCFDELPPRFDRERDGKDVWRAGAEPGTGCPSPRDAEDRDLDWGCCEFDWCRDNTGEDGSEGTGDAVRGCIDPVGVALTASPCPASAVDAVVEREGGRPPPRKRRDNERLLALLFNSGDPADAALEVVEVENVVLCFGGDESEDSVGEAE